MGAGAPGRHPVLLARRQDRRAHRAARTHHRAVAPPRPRARSGWRARCASATASTSSSTRTPTPTSTPRSTSTRFLDATDSDLVNLCLDTGHYAYCGGDSVKLIETYGERIGYLHLKQVDPEILAEVVAQGIAVRARRAAGRDVRAAARACPRWSRSWRRRRGWASTSSPSSSRTCTRARPTSRSPSRSAPGASCGAAGPDACPADLCVALFPGAEQGLPLLVLCRVRACLGLVAQLPAPLRDAPGWARDGNTTFRSRHQRHRYTSPLSQAAHRPSPGVTLRRSHGTG